MATRTIEPVHVVLPDADGGYYRFGDLPRLIADFLYPDDPDADEEAQELQWMKHGWDGVETFQEDLARAAGLTDGEPGYLHVVENSASKRPLKWRMGAVLEAGLVHLDWLNEWGEPRKPQLVFSTVSAPEPQAATPAPVAGSASDASLDTPPPVATGDVAHAFDGLRGWNEKAWKDTLGSPPKWLEACIALRGQRGIREHHWNPVLIGAALVHNGHAKANNIRARFQTKPQLGDWREAWKTYEADNFDTP